MTVNTRTEPEDVHRRVARLLGPNRPGPERARIVNALRRGTSSGTDHYAVPHLADLWNESPWLRTPVLRFAALRATHLDVVQRELSDDDAEDVARYGRAGLSLGQFLHEVAIAGVPAARRNDRGAIASAIERAGQRIIRSQTGDIEKLHMTVRQLMPRRVEPGMPKSVNWLDAARLYVWWDGRDHHRRQRLRQRLLDDYFGHVTTAASSASTTDTTTEESDR